jgi:PAS domain S-box-containing protein
MNSQFVAFLRIFVPVALLVLAGTWFFTESEQARRLEKIKSQETLNVRLGSGSLLRNIGIVVTDLHYFAGHFAMQQLVNNPESAEKHRLENNFKNLVHAKPIYGQVRWVDASGKEVIRVDQIDGVSKLASSKELSFIGDRYYFTEAIKAEAGQLYLSPLDLNMDHGQVEPTLRFATAVADHLGQKRGIIILNYLAKGFLERFSIVTSNIRDHIALVNNEGYWLHAPDEKDAWGFMFNDTQRTLAVRYPKSWERMQGGAGQFQDEKGLWTFESVYPLLSAPDSSTGTAPQTTSNKNSAATDYRWLVVAHVPIAELNASYQSDLLQKWGFAGLLLLIIGFGIWRTIRDNVAIQKSEQRFRAIFDYAMVGMATTSPAKGWLSVNPALCRILGYDGEVLIQKSWVELTHPDDVAADVAKFDAVLRGESDGYSLEKRFIRKDGTIVHAFVTVRAIRKSNGTIDFIAAVIEDVSNWVLAEKEWDDSVKTLQRFIDHLPGTAYVKSSDSRILLASKGFHTHFGLDPKSMQGRLSIEIFGGQLGQKMLADDARILASGHTEVIEEEFNGRHYESTKFIIPRTDGPPELGGVTIDVTQRYLAEANLEKQIRRSAVLLELPKMAETLPEKEFMQFALECAEALTQSKIGFVHFVNEDSLTIELVAWSRNTLEKYCTAAFDSHYPINEAGIWADAARTKAPVMVNDYALATNKHGLPEGHSHLQRFLSIPVIEAGAVRMMTGVGNKDTDYDSFDVETVQLIGNETWRIVRRQRAEDALRLAMQVVNASPVVCFRWATTAGWPVVFVSKNVSQWGYSVNDLMANRPAFSDIIHPDDLERVAAEVTRHTAEGAVGYEQEYRLVTANNKVCWVIDRTVVQRDVEGNAIFYDGVLTDITERKIQQLLLVETLENQQKLNKRLKEAHNQLLQSEKMASIGQLAAGVAHELNNPIGFVHSNLGTLDGYVRDLVAIIAAYEAESESQELTPARENIQRLIQERDFSFIKEDIFSLLAESKDGLGRVSKIVQDLKSFSRVGEQEWKKADLHEGIDSTLNIVKNELKYKVNVLKEYGDIPPVFCLVSQLNQVFMNMLVNAGHAIETQGSITIRTSRHGDDGVCVEFTDTGKGIAPEHLNRIFDPFFTTKPVGMGTGLGLSLSYSIIERHQGRIEVESELGVGSTFRIFLPIQPKPTANNQNTETS